VSFVADGAVTEDEAKSLFVAYSVTDEKSSALHHQLAAVKANMTAFHQTDGDAIAALLVCCFIAY